MIRGNYSSSSRFFESLNLSVVASFLSSLKKIRKSGDGFIACCSGHDDRNPSLSVKLNEDKLLLHCFAGCSYEEILSGAGFKPSDFYEKGEVTLRLARVKSSITKSTGYSDYALSVWNGAVYDAPNHPYSIRKDIRSHSAMRGKVTGAVVGKDVDCLVIPLRNLKTHEVVAVQCINSDGDKQTFGSVKGHGLILGNRLNKLIPWYVCEGYATGYSLVFHHNKGNACAIVAFGKQNMETVARVVADIYQPDRILIMGERDD